MIRRNETRFLQSGVFVVGFVYFLVTSFDSAQESWFASSVLGLGAAVMVMLAVRAFRMGLFVDDKDVLVRGLLRTRRVRIDHISHCVARTSGLYGEVPTLQIEGGRTIVVYCLAGPNLGFRPDDRFVADTVAYLNALLRS